MSNNAKSWTVEVKEVEDSDDLCIDLPNEFLAEVNWEIGDVIEWTKDATNNAFILTKKVDETKDKKFVLVETVSMFRMRYVVELDSNDSSTYALDYVVMNDALEFSQQHLDETIVSHRDISKEEAYELCRQDNEYLSKWSNEKIYEKLITKSDNKSKK